MKKSSYIAIVLSTLITLLIYKNYNIGYFKTILLGCIIAIIIGLIVRLIIYRGLKKND